MPRIRPSDNAPTHSTTSSLGSFDAGYCGVMRSRWMPWLIFGGGGLVASLIRLGPCVQGVWNFNYASAAPCANPAPIRLGIAGVAALMALLLTGISRPEDRRKVWGGALVLAIALAVALLLPRGGPYFHPETRLGRYVGLYSLRNPLRVVIAGLGAFTALVIAFGNLRALPSRHKSRMSRERSPGPNVPA